MLLRKFARYKVYFDASKVYWGYGQFFILLILLLEVKKDTQFGIWFYKYSYITLPAFVLLFIVCAIVFGFFILKYIRPHESSRLNRANPEFMEMHEKIMKMK